MSGSRGGCHCGRIVFEVSGAPEKVWVCNCSICSMKGYLHWFVERDDFTLLTPEEDLATYRFGTRTARHHFCPVCGVAPFYIARSDPDKVDVNARCLEGLDVEGLETELFDGKNWEQFVEERYRR